MSKSKSQAAQQAIAFPPTFSTTAFEGIEVCTVNDDGVNRVALRDVAKLLGYCQRSFNGNLETTCKAQGRDFRAHLKRFTMPGTPHLFFVDLGGVQLLCDVLPPARTATLRKWLADFGGTAGTVYQTVAPAAKIFNAKIAGAAVTVAYSERKIWLRLVDLGPLLGYKKTCGSHVAGLFERHDNDLDGYTVRMRYTRFSPPIFISTEGLQILCDLIRDPARVKALKGWLRSYGQWNDGPERLVARMRGTQLTEAHVMTVVKRTGIAGFKSTITAPQPLEQSTSAQNETTQQAEPEPIAAPPVEAGAQQAALGDYCRKLCKLLTRYGTEHETKMLAASLEGVREAIIKTRPAQGLHDAAYHLYGRFYLAESGMLKPEVKP